MKKSFKILVLILLPIMATSQRMEFLAMDNLWHVQTMDPLASQSYGHIAGVWEKEGLADYIVTSYEFGFQKPIFTWHFSDDLTFEIAAEGCAITQFEFTNREENFRRNLLSIDYIAGLPLILYTKPLTFRLRYYHISSHMGDDYIIRNKISDYVNSANNTYEQIDLTATYPIEHFRFHFGIGAIVRVNQSRKPFMLSGGMEYLLPLNKKTSTNFFTGIYMDSRQEYGFSPAINIGTGVQFGKEDKRSIKILFTYFRGPLPYSVYEGEFRQWLGAAFFLNPF